MSLYSSFVTIYKPVPRPSAVSLYSSFVTVFLQIHMLSGFVSTLLQSVPTECASRWVSVWEEGLALPSLMGLELGEGLRKGHF